MASNYGVALQPASRSFDTTGETTERVGFKSIVVATDFSDAAEKGLRYAIEIARRDSSMLHVVHILGPAVYPYAPTSAWPNLAEQDRVYPRTGQGKTGGATTGRAARSDFPGWRGLRHAE